MKVAREALPTLKGVQSEQRAGAIPRATFDSLAGCKVIH